MYVVIADSRMMCAFGSVPERKSPVNSGPTILSGVSVGRETWTIIRKARM